MAFRFLYSHRLHNEVVCLKSLTSERSYNHHLKKYFSSNHNMNNSLCEKYSCIVVGGKRKRSRSCSRSWYNNNNSCNLENQYQRNCIVLSNVRHKNSIRFFSTTFHNGIQNVVPNNNNISSSSFMCHSYSTKISTTNHSTSSTSNNNNISMNRPTFHVAKIHYDGIIEFLNLEASELLKQCSSIYARDLITLNVTSRQESQLRQSNTNTNTTNATPTTGPSSSSKNNGASISSSPPPYIGSSTLSTPFLRQSSAAIVPRSNKQAIILSFGIVQAVVTLDSILLFEVHNPAVRELAYDLAKTYRNIQEKYNIEQINAEHDNNIIKEIIHISGGNNDDSNNDNNSEGNNNNNVPNLSVVKNHISTIISNRPATTKHSLLSSSFHLFSNSFHKTDKPISTEPNELIFLEYVLRDTVESYHRRLRIYEPITENVLEQVANYNQSSSNKNKGGGGMSILSIYSSDITSVHQLVPLKDSLQSFEIQVKQTLDCLSEILNNDDKMLSLLLTEQNIAIKNDTIVDYLRHEHVELLIGVYARQLSTISMEINYLLNRIQSKQELFTLTLSSYRNRMIQMNIYLSVGTLALAFSTTIAGFYGMNIINGYEQSLTAFPYIMSSSMIGGVIVSVGCLHYFLNGRRMRITALNRMNEIETLTNALSDMPALDYTLKSIFYQKQQLQQQQQQLQLQQQNHDNTNNTNSNNENHPQHQLYNVLHQHLPLDKVQFQHLLRKARYSKHVTNQEVELLFNIFDQVKDGTINVDDFFNLHNNNQHNDYDNYNYENQNHHDIIDNHKGK